MPGFIGAGNMAEAIARRVRAAGVFTTSALLAADPSPARRCETGCKSLYCTRAAGDGDGG